MGLSHLAILSAHPEVDVVAICDNARYLTSALKRKMQIETFTNHKKLFRSCALDAVVVSTPNSTHFEIGQLALEKGIGVFLEKPLCLDPDQSARLAALAKVNNLVNQVGYHNRFIGTFQEMRRVIDGGAIGELYHLEGTAFGQVVIRKKPGKTWRTKRSEGGGCLHDYACHVLDLMNFVYRPPSGVKSSQLQSIFSAGIEDAVYTSLEYEGGATGYLEANWSDQSFRKMSTTITAYGTAGKIIADRQELRVYLNHGNVFESYDQGWTTRYITELQRPVNFYLRGEEYTSQLDQFVGSIQGKPAMVDSTFETATETDRVIKSIAESGQV